MLGYNIEYIELITLLFGAFKYPPIYGSKYMDIVFNSPTHKDFETERAERATTLSLFKMWDV